MSAPTAPQINRNRPTEVRNVGHHAYAQRVLRYVEEDVGALRMSERRACDEYSSELLGHRRYSAWLLLYVALAGCLRGGWIPDDSYGRWVAPRINGAYGRVLHLKPFSKVFQRPHLRPDVGDFEPTFRTTADQKRGTERDSAKRRSEASLP